MQYLNQYLNIEFNEYKQWGPMDMIVISAPTGAGKTHFILNKLLPYAKKKYRKIIYFTNRKALKDQLLRELSLEDRKAIDVFNYQQAEWLIKKLMKAEAKARKADKNKTDAEAKSSSETNDVDEMDNEEFDTIEDTASTQDSASDESTVSDETTAAKKESPPLQMFQIDSTIPDYIIFDEAQYFLSDAEFNPDISNIIRMLYRYR